MARRFSIPLLVIAAIVGAFVAGLIGFAARGVNVPPTRAYYYLWWSSKHWTDSLGSAYPYSQTPLPLPATTDASGCAAKNLYVGNRLLDVPAKLYSQDTAGVIEGHIRAAKAAGLIGFYLNWKGNGSANQTLTSVTYTKRLAEAFAASSRVGGFTNWVSMGTSAKPTVAQLKNDADFLYRQFGAEPSWERVGGKPVLLLTGSRKFSTADVTAFSQYVRGRFHLVGDETNATLTSTRLALFDAVTYYWSTQKPTSGSFATIKSMGDRVHAAGKKWYPPFTPGYNSTLIGGSTCVPRGTTLAALFNGNRPTADGMALISWNEIAENTHVEPLQKWGTRWTDELRGLLVP